MSEESISWIVDELNDMINRLILVCNPADLRVLERNSKLARELSRRDRWVPQAGQAAMVLVEMFDVLGLKSSRREAIITGNKAGRIHAYDLRMFFGQEEDE